MPRALVWCVARWLGPLELRGVAREHRVLVDAERGLSKRAMPPPSMSDALLRWSVRRSNLRHANGDAASSLTVGICLPPPSRDSNDGAALFGVVTHASTLPLAQWRRCPAEALGARRAQGVAGKRPERFLAASPVCVIRVDPKRPPAHRCAWRVSSKRIRTRRGTERSESTSGGRFPASRRGPRTDSAAAAHSGSVATKSS